MPKTTFEQALEDTKKMQKLVEHNAMQAVQNVMQPQIKQLVKEGLREGDDEVPPEEEPPAPVPEPEDEVTEMTIPEDDTEGGEPATGTIDLDKLSAEVEDEFKREGEGDLDIEDEEEDAPPMDEAKDDDKKDDEDEVEVSEADIKEAYNDLVKEFDTPPSGDPDQLDPNTDGKAVGLADKQKQQNDKPWEDVEPPAAEDFTKKEAYYQKLISQSVIKLAEVKKQRDILAGKLREGRVDQTKLALITNLFAKYPNVRKEVKQSIIGKFDSAKTVREAKMLFNTAKGILERLHQRKPVQQESKGGRQNRAPSAPAGRGTGKPSTLQEHAVAPRWKTLADIK